MPTQHSAILSADCHEPKGITSATTADTGKVITPSSTVNGQSELRTLNLSEVNDAGLQLVKAYGGITITQNAVAVAVTAAASSPDFDTPAEYVVVPSGVFDNPSASPSNGMTQGTNTVTVQQTGVYMLDFWASLTSSVVANVVAFDYTVNGVVGAERPLVFRAPNSSDPITATGHAVVSLTAGNIIGIAIAAKETSNIVLKDGRLSLTLLEATV